MYTNRKCTIQFHEHMISHHVKWLLTNDKLISDSEIDKVHDSWAYWIIMFSKQNITNIDLKSQENRSETIQSIFSKWLSPPWPLWLGRYRGLSEDAVLTLLSPPLPQEWSWGLSDDAVLPSLGSLTRFRFRLIAESFGDSGTVSSLLLGDIAIPLYLPMGCACGGKQ